MTEKLLPCPFCWSSASLETGVTADIGGEEIQYVTCVECSAQADRHDWQTRPEAAAPSQHFPGATDAYMRLITLFDQDATAVSFLSEDGDGGFVGGVYRMAREIERLHAPAPEKHVAGREVAIRKAGQVVIDDLIDRGGWCIASNDDLADYMTRIVDACVRAALANTEGSTGGK